MPLLDLCSEGPHLSTVACERVSEAPNTLTQLHVDYLIQYHHHPSSVPVVGLIADGLKRLLVKTKFERTYRTVCITWRVSLIQHSRGFRDMNRDYW